MAVSLSYPWSIIDYCGKKILCVCPLFSFFIILLFFKKLNFFSCLSYSFYQRDGQCPIIVLWSSYQSVIVQVFVWLLSSYNLVIVRLSSSYCQAIIQLSPIIVRLLSGYCSLIVKLSSHNWQVIVQLSFTLVLPLYSTLVSLSYSTGVFSEKLFRLFYVPSFTITGYPVAKN